MVGTHSQILTFLPHDLEKLGSVLFIEIVKGSIFGSSKIKIAGQNLFLLPKNSKMSG